MSFNENNIEAFLKKFNANKHKIRAFKICNFLELYSDKNDTNVFFTHSYWNSEADLEAYRQSDLFKNV